MTSSIRNAALPEIATTAQAAAALNRRPQTLRRWACLGDGPIRPLRIHGRLAWPMERIHELLSRGSK